MKLNDTWNEYPFPYLIIDNFLPENKFIELQRSLNSSKLEVLTAFDTKVEKKIIYKANNLPMKVKEIVNIFAGKNIKDAISKKIGVERLLSLSDTNNFSGYSPLHSTRSNGCLGAHVDHSSINNNKYRHIANTIFYASDRWENGWGGETVLFSRNGLKKIISIDPRPNRLIIFIHTANSFHGVTNYNPKLDLPRLTFYNDYYVKESELDLALGSLNKERNIPLIHSYHATTFIPLFPSGFSSFKFDNLLNLRNLKYILVYIVYLINRTFGTTLTLKKLTIKEIFSMFKK